MKLLINLIYYWLFRLEIYIQSFFNSIVFVILKIFLGERLNREKKNEINKVLNDPINGVNSMLAVVHVAVLVLLLIWGTINFLSGYYRYDFHPTLLQYSILFIVPALIVYMLVLKGNQYQFFFDLFESYSTKSKKLTSLMVLLVVVAIWIFGVSSFIYLNVRL